MDRKGEREELFAPKYLMLNKEEAGEFTALVPNQTNSG